MNPPFKLSISDWTLERLSEDEYMLTRHGWGQTVCGNELLLLYRLLRAADVAAGGQDE